MVSYFYGCIRRVSIVMVLLLVTRISAIQDGGTPEDRILAGCYGLNANISFTFYAIKNSMLISHIYVSGVLVNFLAIVGLFGDKEFSSKDK